MVERERNGFTPIPVAWVPAANQLRDSLQRRFEASHQSHIEIRVVRRQPSRPVVADGILDKREAECPMIVGCAIPQLGSENPVEQQGAGDFADERCFRVRRGAAVPVAEHLKGNLYLGIIRRACRGSVQNILRQMDIFQGMDIGVNSQHALDVEIRTCFEHLKNACGAPGRSPGVREEIRVAIRDNTAVCSRDDAAGRC